MKLQKTWLTIVFSESHSAVELTINYETKKFSITHDNNDENVTFKGDNTDFKTHHDRAKCVIAALNFAKQELTTT